MKLFDEKTHQAVTLPAELETFRGERVRVVRIAQDATSGKAGKIDLGYPGVDHVVRTVFPGVVRCYIADAPREQVPA